MNEQKKAAVSDENREESRRLRMLWDQRKNKMSQAEFGQLFDIGSQAAVGHFLNGHSAISMKAAKGFARGLGCEISDFSPRLGSEVADLQGLAGAAIGHAASPVSIPDSRLELLPDGYVRLEHLSPTPSMGAGTAWTEPVQVVRHLDVLESWVRQKVGSVDYNRIKILTGCGQSMLPTIHDQDLVFVDINQRTIDLPGIYVVDVYGRLLLKRALILSDGTLVLKSDNVDEFPDEERIDLRKSADIITVTGRVKAWWTLRRG